MSEGELRLPKDSVGARIQQLRESAGLSVSELSRKSGVSKSYLWNLENRIEHQQPSANTLYAIAKSLGTSMSDLLGQKLLVERADEPDPVLLRFAKKQKLDSAELASLASIKWRGEPPRTLERWKFVYDALRMSESLDD